NHSSLPEHDAETVHAVFSDVRFELLLVVAGLGATEAETGADVGFFFGPRRVRPTWTVVRNDVGCPDGLVHSALGGCNRAVRNRFGVVHRRRATTTIKAWQVERQPTPTDT